MNGVHSRCSYGWVGEDSEFRGGASAVSLNLSPPGEDRNRLNRVPILRQDADFSFGSALGRGLLQVAIDSYDAIRERGALAQAAVVVEQRPAQVAGVVVEVVHQYL